MLSDLSHARNDETVDESSMLSLVELTEQEKELIISQDFYGITDYHVELFWIDRLVGEMQRMNPKNHSLDHYFDRFAILLRRVEYNPDEGLIEILSALNCTRSEFRYSDNIECIQNVVDKLGIEIDAKSRRAYSSSLGVENSALWAAIIEEVWVMTQSKIFRTRCDQRRRRALRRKNMMESYVRNVLEKYRRVLVLRVDFGYREDYAPFVSEQEARDDLARLFANRRHNKDLLPDLVGYVCCIEWAVKSHYHFHALFMLDGDRRRNAAYLAQVIGNYWVDVVTKGNGRFYNCNLSKQTYKNCGIGMIHQRDSEAVTYLIKDALGYLLNKEQYLVAKSLEHSKSVFRGVLR